VWDRIDRLLLRSRTEPPAREEAALTGLPRFVGALRRDRPCRVPESGAGTSNELVGSGVSGCTSASGLSSDVLSDSLALALPLGFRCDLGLAGLCFEELNGTKSSIGSMSGRGVPGAPPGVPGIWGFQKVFAERGVLAALWGDRLWSGVEKDCLAWVTNGCAGGAPGLLAPGVWCWV
jgi:hypothetical protein